MWQQVDGKQQNCVVLVTKLVAYLPVSWISAVCLLATVWKRIIFVVFSDFTLLGPIYFKPVTQQLSHYLTTIGTNF